jgi:hypothetical protein
MRLFSPRMVRPRVAGGGNDLQIWKVAANVVNKQQWANDNGWSSSLKVGCGVETSGHKI